MYFHSLTKKHNVAIFTTMHSTLQLFTLIAHSAIDLFVAPIKGKQQQTSLMILTFLILPTT